MIKILKSSFIALAVALASVPAVQASPLAVAEGSFQVEESAFDWGQSAVSLPQAESLHFKTMTESTHGTTIFGLPINEGPIDRSLRAVVALGLIGTGIYGLSSGNISEPVSYTLLGVSAVPVLTAATGYCPLYSLFGVEYTF